MMSRSGISSRCGPWPLPQQTCSLTCSWRNAPQGVVQRLHPERRVPPVLGHRHVGEHLPPVGQVRVVQLQQQPGVRDRRVLLVQHVGDRAEERLVVRVVVVPQPVLHGARRDRGQERGHVMRARRRRQPVDVGLDGGRARVPERAGAHVPRRQAGDLRRRHGSLEVEAAEASSEEAGEVPAVAARHSGVGRRTVPAGLGLESGHPVADVASEQPPLGDLPVVDDVNAGGRLPADDLRHRAGKRRVDGVLGTRARAEEALQGIGPW